MSHWRSTEKTVKKLKPLSEILKHPDVDKELSDWNINENMFTIWSKARKKCIMISREYMENFFGTNEPLVTFLRDSNEGINCYELFHSDISEKFHSILAYEYFFVTEIEEFLTDKDFLL